MLKLKFSRHEKFEIIKSWLAISIAFGIVLTPSLLTLDILSSFVIAGLTVGIGFLFHELAHKWVAQRYKCHSEYKSFDSMLVFAIFLALATRLLFGFGFIFAAPGAVFIHGIVNIEKNGKISMAGPLVNLVLAVLFFALLNLSEGYLYMLSSYGFLVNSWLALFNMIPIGNFDGLKVLAWSKAAYFIIAAVAFIFTFIL